MPKRILQGVVVSDKQEKTLVVKVERRFTHPLLKKTVRRYEELPCARREQDPEGRRHRLHPGDQADLEAEALDRHRRDRADGMRARERSFEFHPGGDEPPSGVVRRREMPETVLIRKAIRP